MYIIVDAFEQWQKSKGKLQELEIRGRFVCICEYTDICAGNVRRFLITQSTAITTWHLMWAFKKKKIEHTINDIQRRLNERRNEEKK